MRFIFNQTGTHIRNGILKVRIDLYPDPEDKTYLQHYIEKYDREPTGEELADPAKLALVPTHQELNPCLCHFIEVPADVTRAGLQSYLASIFTADNLATLDNALVQPNAIHLVSPFMRALPGMAAAKVGSKADAAALIAAANAQLAGLNIAGESGGTGQTIIPKSIDVGHSADAANDYGMNWTLVAKDNPANADGTIDTIQIRFKTVDASDCFAGIFYLDSGTTYICRDAVELGAVTAGSTQTFTGLSLAVVTGDLIGCYDHDGHLELNSSGGSGCVYYTGSNKCVKDLSTTFTDNSNAWWIALYGTGTESGGATEKTSADTGAGIESLESRSLSAPDGGYGLEGLQGRALLVADAGQGSENAYVPGMEVLFGGDTGRGIDSLAALTARTGPGMKLQPDRGRVGLPHKEVNL
jgi:hypothetical protein